MWKMTSELRNPKYYKGTVLEKRKFMKVGEEHMKVWEGGTLTNVRLGQRLQRPRLAASDVRSKEHQRMATLQGTHRQASQRVRLKVHIRRSEASFSMVGCHRHLQKLVGRGVWPAEEIQGLMRKNTLEYGRLGLRSWWVRLALPVVRVQE